MNSIHKKNIIIYTIISNLLQSCLILLITLILCIIVKENIQPYKDAIALGFLVLIIYRLYASFIAPFIAVHIFKYCIDEKKIEYTEGVITSKKTTIPMRNVQQVTTQTNPLLTKLGLVKINISTLSGTHALKSVSIDEGVHIVDTVSETLAHLTPDKRVGHLNDAK